MLEIIIDILAMLGVTSTIWLIIMVFGFEHQNAAKIYDLITDAYRSVKIGDTVTAGLKLAKASGSIQGTFFHYPWVHPHRDFNKAIWHPEIDQSIGEK